MGVKPLPLSLLLVQLGACADAQRWGRGRSLTATTLRACPSREWRAWLAKKLGVSTRAAWLAWRAAALRALGDGSGYGSGDGYGYGSGYGSGDGSGSGYGSGDGYGSGSGSGDGYGSGYGDGSGDGYGSGIRITRTYQAA